MSELTPQQVERYSRQLILPGFGARGQKRLERASVFVAGAGGLGAPILQYLAAAGVGRLTVVDPDRVELSNLGRQVLFSTADVGRQKVDVASAAIKALNPDVRFSPIVAECTSHNLGELTAGHEILVDATDSLDVKFAINDEAVRTGRSCVIGAVLGFEGQVITVRPRGACFRCLFEEPPPPELLRTCQTNGVLGSLVGTVGTLQATEVLKLLLGVGTSRAGSVLQVDALSGGFRRVHFRQRAGCVTCADAG